MKNLSLSTLFAAIAIFAITACGGEKAADTSAVVDEAKASVTSPATPSASINPAADPAAAVPTGPLTSIEFAEDTYDYGTVMEGEKVVHEYKFKNTGKEPLIISNAKGSCGCTVPDWPREPIPVGGDGVIKVQFDSKGKGKVGGQSQSKKVTITANTDPANSYLTIKGNVDKKEENPS